MTTPNRTLRARASNEEGMALIAAILLLMVMSGLCAAVAISGNTETAIARNHETGAQARAAAEAGLIHAVELVVNNLEDWSDNGFANESAAMSALLRGPDGATGTTATDADNGSLESLGIPRSPGTLALAGLPDITYEARVYDEDDTARGVTLSAADLTRIGEAGNVATTDENSRIVIQAVGYASGSALARVEATISPITLPAIVTNGNLTISGNPTIAGTEGSVHSNANLVISGSPSVAENATASGNYTDTGNPTVGGVSGGNTTNLTVPPIQASDYISEADYILNDDGTMTTVSTGVTAACNPCAGSWTFSGGTWSITSNTAPTAATYYVEGDATISGNPGTNASPAQLSIIAEGSILLSGSPDIRPDSVEVMFVTDGDLKISGNVDLAYVEGQILVHEQLSLEGNPEIAGQILVEDATSASSLVTTNSISGSPTLVYNGVAGSSMFTVSAWRWR